MSLCTIEWLNNLNRDTWHSLLQECEHTTLLQSYYYAQTMREVHQQGARFGLTIIDGKQAGIFQIQEVSLFKQVIHGVSLDRGPLWFNDFGKDKHIHAFAEALNKEFPSRFGRKRRFIPEHQSKNSVFSLNSWKKQEKRKEYRSFIVDICSDLERMRKNLKQKWRNALSKAEKMEIFTEIDENMENLSGFLNQYMKDRVQKRYSGASPKFLATMAKHAAMEGECFLLNAYEKKTCIASILVFTHGTGATYQTGWTTEEGRKKNATHLLLWHAIKILKERGITHFDIGGHNQDSEGLRTFKAGLGGHEIALIGSYC